MKHIRVVAIGIVGLLVGCADVSPSSSHAGNGATPGAGPFGEPLYCPLLEPFAGIWVFDSEMTLEASQLSADEIAELRKFYQNNPALGSIKQMHPDLTITGNVAVGEESFRGPPATSFWREYRFFDMHRHSQFPGICGKAWFHEDRFDPGDMTECRVRLSVVNDTLRMELKMRDGPIEMNNPGLNGTPCEWADATDCDADNPIGVDWDPEWHVTVFRRK